MRKIDRINLGDHVITNLVKSVNDIIDVLPSLEVRGDNNTVTVNHTAFGTTIAAKPQSAGGTQGGTTVVSSLIETPLPYQWDVELSSSISSYLDENPSAQLSSMTAEEILSFPYNISFKKVPNNLNYSYMDCTYGDYKATTGFRNGQVLLSGLSGMNDIILSTHYFTEGSTKRIRSALFPISGTLYNVSLDGTSYLDLASVTAASGTFPTCINRNGKTLVRLQDSYNPEYSVDWKITRPSFESIEVKMSTTQNRGGRIWIYNSEYYAPSASFTYDDIEAVSGANQYVGIFAHVKYSSNDGYSGSIDLNPVLDDPDVFYTREIGVVRCVDFSDNPATSSVWPQRYIDIRWNDRNVPIDLRGFWVRW